MLEGMAKKADWSGWTARVDGKHRNAHVNDNTVAPGGRYVARSAYNGLTKRARTLVGALRNASQYARAGGEVDVFDGMRTTRKLGDKPGTRLATCAYKFKGTQRNLSHASCQLTEAGKRLLAAEKRKHKR